MNPFHLLQLKPLWDQFQENHPKFPAFWKAVYKNKLLDEGASIEITVTSSSGKQLSSNIRVQSSDLALLEELIKALAN